MNGLKAKQVCAAMLLACGGFSSTLFANTGSSEDASSDAGLQAFQQCVAALQQRALTENISTDVVKNQLGRVQYVTRVIELDRRQPEFTETFHNYLTLRVNDQRIQRGRELMQEHQDLLHRLTVQYGVPAQYLIAFWGLETNFGTYLGKMNVLDSLATLACDPRRSDYFSGELMKALRLVEQGVADHSTMLGSWAGAMGNMQFMPSAYLSYAVDADGDGKADLWNSLPDALTSAANFLQNLGWERNLRWGREVLLPDQFDYSQAGRDVSKPLKHWAGLGVTDAQGNPLPALDMASSIIVPSGHNGPAFVVYDNFKVIMKWNWSEFYAIAVGRLADRINGGGALKVAPPDTERLTVESVKWLQDTLNGLGFDAGVADGIFGSRTKRALRDYQHQQKMVADGFPGEEVFASLKKNQTETVQEATP